MLNNIRTKLLVFFALISLSDVNLIAGLSMLPYGVYVWTGEGNSKRDNDEVNISLKISFSYEESESNRVQHTVDRNDTDLRDSYHDNRRDMATGSPDDYDKKLSSGVRKTQSSKNKLDGTNFIELEQKRNAASTLSNQYFKSYTVTDAGLQLISECKQDPGLLRSLTGTELQHQLHGEFIQIIDKSATQYYNKSLPSNLREFHKDLAEITVVGIKQNISRNTAKASSIANFCWAALDYGKVIGSYANNALQLTTHAINNVSAYGQIVVDKLADVTEKFLLTDTARIIAPYFSARVQASHKLALLLHNNSEAIQKGLSVEQKKIFVDNLYKEFFNYESKFNIKAVDDFTKGLCQGSLDFGKKIKNDPLGYCISFLTMPLKPLMYGAQKIIQYKAISTLAEHDPQQAIDLAQELNEQVKNDFDELYNHVTNFSKLTYQERGKIIAPMILDLVIAQKVVFPTVNRTISMMRNANPKVCNPNTISAIEEVLTTIRHQKPEKVIDLLGVKFASYPEGVVVAAAQTKNTQVMAVLNDGQTSLAKQANLLANVKETNEIAVLAAYKNVESVTNSAAKIAEAAKSADLPVENACSSVKQEILPEQPFCQLEAEKILANSEELRELNMNIDRINSRTIKEKISSLEGSTIGTKEYEKLEKRACELYEKIRTDKNDVAIVSKNTGIKQSIIEKIKNHVFMDQHLLADGLKQFDPQIDIANAWIRLVDGEFAKSDLLWLKHEFAESLIMRDISVKWSDAHPLINKHYDWQKLIRGF
ncbi:hypothetical protein Noda2021_05580 [Candidatus Dependentiae bacterium Noda2021]|nr:hypothetical protein Noda2021_05580 [Candidatus Dependentiae bacterium Noda2021]